MSLVLALASSIPFLGLESVSVLGKAVLGLGLGVFLCPWPWPRALSPRLHLWSTMQEALSLLARGISALQNPLTLEYVFNGEALIISVMQFFHRPNSLCGNVLSSGAEGHGFKSNTELPTTHHRCDISSKGAVLPKCIVAATDQANSLQVWRNTVSIKIWIFFKVIVCVDSFTEHVIRVTTKQVRDSMIV